MANGKAAMELMGQWAPGSDQAVATDLAKFLDDLGFFPFPTVEGRRGRSVRRARRRRRLRDRQERAARDDRLRALPDQPRHAEGDGGGRASPCRRRSRAPRRAVIGPADAAGADSRLQRAKYYQLYYDQYMPPAVGSTVNDQTQALFAGIVSGRRGRQGDRRLRGQRDQEEVAATSRPGGRGRM